MKRQLNMWIPEELDERLRAEARESGLSLTRIVERSLDKSLPRAVSIVMPEPVPVVVESQVCPGEDRECGKPEPITMTKATLLRMTPGVRRAWMVEVAKIDPLRDEDEARVWIEENLK